jgi:hypothetical protein
VSGEVPRRHAEVTVTVTVDGTTHSFTADDTGYDPDDVVTCVDGSSATVGALADLADLMFANERRAHDANTDLYHLAAGRPGSDCTYCLNPEFGKDGH